MKRELVIVGGGPAGLAAAIRAKEEGIKDILILERDKELGGILNQCIHNGFGLHTFNEELTGPEYAARYVDMVLAAKIDYMLNTMVVDIKGAAKEGCGGAVVTAMNSKQGLFTIEAGAVVLAMGCREKARGAMNIPGYRPAGIYSAGTAQRYVNIEGRMPGRKVVIIGSGDIGLIMARRMTLQGAEVKCVAEIMPYSGGLRRNIMQCLDDYNIPLLLSHTVTEIRGKERVEGVVIQKVDENLSPIPGTEEYYECDTLLLSCGLVPENELSKLAGCEMDSVTQGPVVNASLETTAYGVFACGNVLHVHDLVDNVTKEAVKAGEFAAQYIKNAPENWGEAVRPKIPAKSKNTIPENMDRTSQVICIGCPMGCLVTAKRNENGELVITGNTCPKGEAFARNEMTNPVREITSFVKVTGGERPVVAVKTSTEIPKGLIKACMEDINKVTVKAPLHVGDVVLKNVAGCGADVIATANMNKA